MINIKLGLKQICTPASPFIEQVSYSVGYYVPHTVTHTPCSSYRVQRKVVSLCVYKDGDWLQLSTLPDRYDSMNTIVMHCATNAIPIPVGDHVVLTHLQYPVHSSQYYKQRSSASHKTVNFE